MRIVCITLEFAPFKGGVARYIAGFVQQLRRSGHSVRVFGPDLGCDYVMQLQSRWFKPRWVLPLFRLMQMMRVDRPDLIIVSHVIPIGLMARVIFRVLGIPYVVIVHGMDLLIPRVLKRRQMKRVLHDARLVVCNSSYTESIAQDLTQTPTMIVYPGVDITSSIDSCSSHQVLSVGRLVERKGFDVLIRAMEYVRERISDASLVIVGSGSDYGRLEHLIGDKSYVRIMSDLDDAGLHEQYIESCVFAMLPRNIHGDVEGFGMVFVEASMRGLPIIVGNSGGSSETVVHGTTGFLVDPMDYERVGDYIVQLFRDRELALRMGQEGRGYVMKNFLWEHTVAPFLRYISDSNQLVSVIIPVYNHADDLKKCIDSIQKQTYWNIEIIVVDDGSDDYFSVPQGITLIRQHNQGAPAARNKGFSQAHGEFVLFCDADIIMQPTMITDMVDALVRGGASFAYSDFIFGWKLFKTPVFNPRMLSKRNYVHTASLLRSSDFPGFDESLKKFQDWDLWLTMIEHGKKAVKVPGVLFRVRTRKNGMSHWLPSFVYRFGKLKRVAQYRDAEKIIRDKHQL